MPEPLDLRHLGHERVIGSYLLETDDGPALQDCGPTTLRPRAEGAARRARPRARGRAPPAALAHPPRPRGRRGRARARAPRAAGARLGDRRAAPRRPEPPRAQRAPALRRRLRPALGRARARPGGERPRRRRPRRSASRRFPSPGHASHHVCYLDRDGTLYAGDAAGVRIQPSEFVLPPTPPPEVDLEAWERTLDEIERREPAAPGADPLRRLRGRRAPPRRAAPRACASGPSAVRDGASEEEFAAEAERRPRRRPRRLRAGDAVLAVVRRPEALLGEACCVASARSASASSACSSSARTISFVGSAFANVALAFAVLDLTGSKADLGYVLAARTRADGGLPARRRDLGRPPAAPPRDGRLEPRSRARARPRSRPCSSPATRRSGSSPRSRR